MSIIKIYYFTFIACLYWILLSIHKGININPAYAGWFYTYLGVHLFFFAYWSYDSFGWHFHERIRYVKGKKIELGAETFHFNPLTGKVHAYGLNTKNEELNDCLRDDIIEENIMLSMGMLIIFNMIYSLFYTINLFIPFDFNNHFYLGDYIGDMFYELFY